MKQLLSITIPNFTNTIVISNKQQVKPYKRGFKTPKLPKYLSDNIGIDYFWDAKGKLVDKFKNIVPSNKSKAGTPRLYEVNFQDLHGGKLNGFQINQRIEKMKEFILPYFTDREFIDEENLKVELIFKLYDKRRNKTRDNKMLDEDNLVPLWQKACRDVMKMTIVKDDDQNTFRASENSIEYVETEAEQTLEIILWKR